MWNALDEICHREKCTIHDICTLVDSKRKDSSLTAAMRVFILAYFRAAATDEGHQRAGQGTVSKEYQEIFKRAASPLTADA